MTKTKKIVIRGKVGRRMALNERVFLASMKCYCGDPTVPATVLCAEHFKKNDEQQKKYVGRD